MLFAFFGRPSLNHLSLKPTLRASSIKHQLPFRFCQSGRTRIGRGYSGRGIGISLTHFYPGERYRLPNNVKKIPPNYTMSDEARLALILTQLGRKRVNSRKFENQTILKSGLPTHRSSTLSTRQSLIKETK